MHALTFGLAWGFIFLAAIYDSCFAWYYRANFSLWEQNPLARWGFDNIGLPGVFTFKFAGLVFAAGVAFYCHRRSLSAGRVLTLTLTTAYLLLAAHYCVEHDRADSRHAGLTQSAHLAK